MLWYILRDELLLESVAVDNSGCKNSLSPLLLSYGVTLHSLQANFFFCTLKMPNTCFTCDL